MNDAHLVRHPMQERDLFRASTSSDFAAELSCVRALSAMLSPTIFFHQWAGLNTVQNQVQGEIAAHSVSLRKMAIVGG